MKTLKVLVLYGGQNANTPRDALLNWLNSDNLHDNIGFKIDARKVADMPPNAGNSVDDRVTQAMNWADKGIMLVTPDDRTAGFGAPNTLEEIGRWRGMKGGETLSIVYKKGMEIPSNLSGLVYSSFKEDIIVDCSIKLVRFLADPIQASASASKSSEPQSSQSNSGTTFNIGSVGGDLVSGDKVGGNVNKAERDVNVTHNHYYGQLDQSTQNEPRENTGTSSSTNLSMPTLRRILNKFEIDEIDDLFMDLGIDKEKYGSTKGPKIRGLLTHLNNRDQLGPLVELIKNDHRFSAQT